MNIFEQPDYKSVVKSWIDQQPKKHGQLRKIADVLTLNPASVTMIFNGDRDLTLEQAIVLSEYMGLAGLEKEYFLLLVQAERAGHHSLKEYFAEKIRAVVKASRDLSTKIPHKKILDEQGRAVFYSNWYYSGIRMLIATHESISVQELADRVGVSYQTLNQVLTFLLEHGLCVRTEKGLRPVSQVTHLEKSSPFVSQNHANWRLKGIERMRRPSEEELFYSAPMALSEELFSKIRSELESLIKKVTAQVPKSTPETPACLNIDWFKF